MYIDDYIVVESVTMDGIKALDGNNADDGKRPSWIPDQWAANCQTCRKPFSQMRRKVLYFLIYIF
jgi:hypothetical protein